MSKKINSIIILLILFIYLAFSSGSAQICSNLIVTEKVKEKVTPEAYIKKDEPTAIYIEGNPEPVLRIEDLPKQFPPHIQHPEGARFPDTRFNLASLSPDAQRIAFSCGAVHNWVGLYELKSKKIHVVTWLFDTPIDEILWSSNSKYFAYTFGPPSGGRVVAITAFYEKTQEPYMSNSWFSGIRNPVLISDLRWSKDGESLQFETQKYEIKNLKIKIIEDEQAKTITLKAIGEETVKEAPKKEKVKKTKYKDPR